MPVDSRPISGKQYPLGVEFFLLSSRCAPATFVTMPAVHHVCRLATVEDIKKSAHVWGRDQVLFDTDVWAQMPGLLESLWRNESVRLAYIESLPNCEPRMLGGISFIDPEYVSEARTKQSTLPNTVFRAALEGRTPFLSPKVIAKLNARCELHLMNFFGNFDDVDLTRSEMANFYDVSNHGYHFFHFGYAYRALWVEVSPRFHVRELQVHGMQIERELQLSNGQTSTLMCLTREFARANPYLRRSAYFFPPVPRFQFSLGEQGVLELCMLEMPDEDIAARLHVSMDAIKKRWRSIYVKVDLADPGLLADVDSGTARRRALLNYLKMHLEEIRPYSW